MTADLEAASYRELRRQVDAWPQDEEAARAAYRELVARRRVVERRGWDADAAERFGPPEIVVRAPWLDLAAALAGPRVTRWRRPAGSTLYPSDEDLEREAVDRVARAYWSGRRAAEEA